MCGRSCRATGQKARIFISITGRLQAQSRLGLAHSGRVSTERSVVRVFMSSMRYRAWTSSLEVWADAKKRRAGPQVCGHALRAMTRVQPGVRVYREGGTGVNIWRTGGLGPVLALCLGFSSSTVAPVASRWDTLVAPRIVMRMQGGSYVERHASVGVCGRTGHHLDTVRAGRQGGLVVMHRYMGLEDMHHVVQALGELRYFLV